ncbi:MAG: CvpA family protein [Planctomycetota bacterium]|nr:CvpA family protein [Planctomycetota bacterium]
MLTDILLVAFLLFQAWMGWRSGLMWQAVAMASVGFGVLLGTALAPALGARLLGTVTGSAFHAKLVGFLFVAGVVCLALRIAATWAEQQSETGLPPKEREVRRGHDRILGGIFGALKGGVIALVLAAAAVTLWPQEQVWQSSRLVPPLAQAGARLLPDGALDEMKQRLRVSMEEWKESPDPRAAEAREPADSE